MSALEEGFRGGQVRPEHRDDEERVDVVQGRAVFTYDSGPPYSRKTLIEMAAATMTNAASNPATAPSGNAIETAHEDMIVSIPSIRFGPSTDTLSAT